MSTCTVSGTGDTAVYTTDRIHLFSWHLHSGGGIGNKCVNTLNNTITGYDKCYETQRKSNAIEKTC